MDIADQSQQTEALFMAESQAKSRHPELIAVGFCHHCGETVKPGHLYCDADCRDDYEKHQQARKRSGG